AIGDADHGINLSRGIRAAVTMLDETAPATPAAVLATVGRALISKTGGASGPLYGTAFRAAAKTLGEDPDVSPVQLGAALAVAPAGRADGPVPALSGPVDPGRVDEAFREVAADLSTLADRARAQGRHAAADIVATGALIATDPGLVDAARRSATPDGIHEAVEGYARMP